MYEWVFWEERMQRVIQITCILITNCFSKKPHTANGLNYDNWMVGLT